MTRHTLAGWFGCLLFVAALQANPPASDVEAFFETKIRPVLVAQCVSCHGPEKQKASLRLDSSTAFAKGGESGPLIVPGKPDQSRLLHALRHDGETKMPPKGKLAAEVIADFEQWIRAGAVWPNQQATRPAEAWRSHWAFQPLKLTRPLEVTSPQFIDRIINETLKTKGLPPEAPADRATLIRRAYFDLQGLPPTYAAVQAFVNRPGSDTEAFAELVDQLLASPHFGERWARHWLDLARYADNRGYVGVGVDRTYPFAYTFRDYVVRAFNRDLPYDQFLREQIAADLLPTVTDSTSLAAPGFFTVGRRFINNIHDIIDDRIDVLTRTTMGLTVACARCHDHKYDPISIQDYYALYGVFASTHEPDLENMPLLMGMAGGPKFDEFNKELTRLKDAKAKFERDNAEMRAKEPIKFSEQIKPYDNRIKQLYSKHPGAPPRGMTLRDNDKPVEPHVFVRGNPGNRGPKVPRRFVAFLSGGSPKPFEHGSGRLELAEAITRADNPLTARVMVNRVWGHLFGKPLVPTPSDFGLRSEPPSHPELLDGLAAGFIADGWSVKRLIRRIMLSETYQRSSVGHEISWRLDPDNRWLSRQNRRRLDFEALRDGLLAAAGRLDLQLGGPSVDLFRTPFSTRRSIYGFIDRQNLPGVFRTFDFALPDTHSPQRFTTIVPQQALYLMNSAFMHEQARHLALRTAAAGDPTARVQDMYRLVFARDARPGEVFLALGFVTSFADKSADAWEALAQTLLMANEFLYVD
jgi:cytochrome c553